MSAVKSDCRFSLLSVVKPEEKAEKELLLLRKLSSVLRALPKVGAEWSGVSFFSILKDCVVSCADRLGSLGRMSTAFSEGVLS